MNIFTVLSQGASRLHEPSMSAFLGYLLDTGKDHGLNDIFVRAFLQCVDADGFSSILANDYIKSAVELERKYDYNGSVRSIDIEVILSLDGAPAFRLIIENKINVGAASAQQLAEYYRAVVDDERDDRSAENLYFIFLTPYSLAAGLTQQFSNLELDPGRKHYKRWIHWDSDSGRGILPSIRNLLADEVTGGINPINEYMRHTLKAFVRHAAAVTQRNPAKMIRNMEESGDIHSEISIGSAEGQRYTVLLRTSGQVQVFNESTGEKEVARRILTKLSDEYGLDLPYDRYATRRLGEAFFSFPWQEKNIIDTNGQPVKVIIRATET
jgi:hypothetical protein